MPFVFSDMVEFGIHVADNKTVFKKIVIRNVGCTPVTYRIGYKGEHPIAFTPQSAVVQPNSSLSVEVALLTSKLMYIDDIATYARLHPLLSRSRRVRLFVGSKPVIRSLRSS